MPECDERVFKYGDVVAITDMPKEQADQHCKDMTANSDRQYDWHYSGGRVVIKALKKGYITDKDRIAQLEAQLERVKRAVIEMHNDNIKGDFDLPRLARIDLNAVMEAADITPPQPTPA